MNVPSNWRVADPEERKGRGLVFPSVGEYPIYDATAYELMMTDRFRVDAFTHGLQTAVRPNSTVVEIGCGALAPWARLADDLGAARVIAVEYLPEVREEARRLVTEEGRADSVSVISPKEYATFNERVDILVAEVIGTIGGSEGAADTIGTEITRIGNPDLIVLPGGWKSEIRGFDFARSSAGRRPAFPPTALPYLDQLRELVGSDVDPRLCAVGPFVAEGVLTDGRVIEYGNYSGTRGEYSTTSVQLVVVTPGTLDSFLVSVRVMIGESEVDSLTQETSWFPVIVPLPGPIEVSPGTVIDVAASSHPGLGGSCLDYSFAWSVQPPNGRHESGVVDVPWRSSELGSNPLTRDLLIEH